MLKDFYLAQRKIMVDTQLKARSITDSNVLAAFMQVQRDLFVPEAVKKQAYNDCPLPIGCAQTISQPYMVALMSELLEIKPQMKVLEIGTGSGYQAAILYALGARVFTVERFPSLANKCKDLFERLSLKIDFKEGDGTLGWEEYSPYDRIIITAASARLPKSLCRQLKIGGRLIAPIGNKLYQDLKVYDKYGDNDFAEKSICGCIFVPLVGEGI